MAKQKNILRDQAFIRRLCATGRHDELDAMITLLIDKGYRVWYNLNTRLLMVSSKY